MTVSLRLATPADGAAVAALYAPYVRDTCITFEYDVPDGAEFGQRIETVLRLAPWLLAVETRDGREQLLGYAYGGTWRTRTRAFLLGAATGAAFALLSEPSEILCRPMSQKSIARKVTASTSGIVMPTTRPGRMST